MLSFVPSMRHWIDGSFVTAKQEPNDIDLVCFVKFEDVRFITDKLAQFDTNFSQHQCKKVYNVDGYIVIEVPEDDPRYKSYYLKRVAYWKKWFGYDREGRRKGVVELRYG